MRVKLEPLLRLVKRGISHPEQAFQGFSHLLPLWADTSIRLAQKRHYSGPPPGKVYFFPNKIGSREIVGFGMNGKPDYVDSSTFPYPAVRFREINPDYKALKEKEKGNWKMLTVNEKKCLYRISFCKTMAEIEAPTGEWKKITGSTLIVISMALWFYMFIIFMTRDKLPETFETERQLAQLKRMLDLHMEPIEGISSKWDYETENWKGKGSRAPKKKEKKKTDDDD